MPSDLRTKTENAGHAGSDYAAATDPREGGRELNRFPHPDRARGECWQSARLMSAPDAVRAEAASSSRVTPDRERSAELAYEQAALRRIATLVTRGVPAAEIFDAVAEEVGPLLGAEIAAIQSYEPDGYTTLLGSWGKLRDAFPVGRRWKLQGDNVTTLVYRTERPVRLDRYEKATGSVPAEVRAAGVHSVVASPIVVGGRLWGVIVAATSRAKVLRTDAESRIWEFTELVATAISNVQARSDLAASRARMVAGADEERRRLARDLHDGAQQGLVHTIITLNLAQRAHDNEDHEGAWALVGEARRHAEQANAELRELAHGTLPSALTDGGLGRGIDALASRMSIPVELDIAVDRFGPLVEATAYFVVAEALTNVAKHSHAHRATVRARLKNRHLQVEVRDNGVGGARADGSGLGGLTERLAAVAGSLRIESPAHFGTVIAASIPVR